MLIRAAFLIGLIYVLAPHEPDLGLGRPGAGVTLPSSASILSAIGLSAGKLSAGDLLHPEKICGSCAASPELALPKAMPIQGSRGLSDIRAEIQEAIRLRESHGS